MFRRGAPAGGRRRLVIYTDGISEAAPSEEAEEFGDERLIQSVRDSPV